MVDALVWLPWVRLHSGRSFFIFMRTSFLNFVALQQAEKNELREEKLTLKADKERMEQQLKVIAVPPSGFMPAHPAAYHAGVNKMAVFPGYGLMPMWQLPLASRDISRDHEYWPPAA